MESTGIYWKSPYAALEKGHQGVSEFLCVRREETFPR
jgi:hypothetical protein